MSDDEHYEPDEEEIDTDEGQNGKAGASDGADELDEEPGGRRGRRSRRANDEEGLQELEPPALVKYGLPVLLAGPFLFYTVYRGIHYVVHAVISFPLDYIITPMETSRRTRKTVNGFGLLCKWGVRFGWLPLALYVGWLTCPGVLKPNLWSLVFPWLPPWSEITYERWIKKFYLQEARQPMGASYRPDHLGPR